MLESILSLSSFFFFPSPFCLSPHPNSGHPSGESHCWYGYKGTRPSRKASEPSNEVAAGMVGSYPHFIKTQKLSVPPFPVCFPAYPQARLQRAWKPASRTQMCTAVFAAWVDQVQPMPSGDHWEGRGGVRMAWGGMGVNHHNSGEIKIGVWPQSCSL